MNSHLQSEIGNARILVLFNSSWGEVDWILPVLHALKEQGATIYAHFLDEWLLQQGEDFQDLALELENVCLALCSHERLLRDAAEKAGKPLLRNDRELLFELMDGQCDFILHDYSGIDMSSYYNIFPDADVVVFPHGTFQYSEVQDQLVDLASSVLAYNTINRDAALIVGAEQEIPYFRKVTKLEQITAVGYPKFDPAWVKRKCEQRAPSDGKPIALLLPIPARKINSNYYIWLLQTTVKVLQSHGVEVHIRRHPRQERGEVMRVLAALPEEGVSIVHDSVLHAACGAAFAIAFPSSAVMDCIAVNIPVIEFFDYTDQNWLTFSKKQDKLTSIYRSGGLVAPAENEQELDELVRKLLHDSGYRKTLQAEQQKAFGQVRGPVSPIQNVIEVMAALKK